MSPKHREMGLLEKADGLATTQEDFTAKQGIKLYGENPEGGSEAICHNAVVEDLALPGQIVIGTDSHTCMAGVLGCFAFGVGSTDMANAWYTKDIRIRVPETVRYVLKGKKRADVAAKDVMLVHPRQRVHEDEQRHRQGAGVCRRGSEELADGRTRDAHQHGGRGRRHHRHHRAGRSRRSTTS